MLTRAENYLDRVLARPWSSVQVTIIGTAMVLLSTAFRAWIVVPSWFFLDDYIYLDDAHRQPFGTDWLLEPYNGHLMPGARLLISLVAASGPLSWPVAATSSLVLQAGAGLACLWCLMRVFGPRPGILVPLAIYLSTAITVPGLVWWAAAINLVPVQIALLTAIACWIESLRSGDVKWRLGTLLCVAVGMSFDVRGVLILPVLAIIALTYFAAGGPLRRATELWRRHRPDTMAIVATGAAYSAYYLSQVEQVTRPPSWAALTGVGSAALGSSLPTGALGGPWRWQAPAPPTALADPPWGLVLLAWVVLTIVVGWMALRRGRTLRAFLPMLAHLAALIWLVAGTRGSASALVGTEYRFFTEMGVLLALTLGLATMPLPGATASSHTRHRSLVPPVPRLLAGALLVLVVAGGTWSAATYAHVWHTRNASAPYTQGLAADLASVGRVDVAATVTPEDVLSPLVFPRNTTKTLTEPLSPLVSFPRTSALLFVVNEKGRLREAVLDPSVTSEGGPAANCGWRMTSTGLEVPLRGRVPAGFTWLRIGYLSSASSPVTITAGGVEVSTRVRAGLRSLFVQVGGAFSTVRIDGLAPGATLCVDTIEVGDPVPREGG